MDKLKYHDILYSDQQVGPYPDHLLKRVDKLTNRIPGPVGRVSGRESPFARSLLSDNGGDIQESFKKMRVRYPPRPAHPRAT